MSIRGLDPKEEGKARLEPNDKLPKFQIRAVAEKFTFIGQDYQRT